MIEIFKTIILEKDSNISLYIQLYEQLKQLITDSTLLAEFKLPSVRKLSALLVVNQITVVSAFKRLETEGLIYSKPGSGTYVSNIQLRKSNNINQDNNIILDELYQQDYFLLTNNGQIQIKEDTINFASASPTPDLFPVEDFKTVLNEVLDRDKGNAFDYQESHGFLPLRESVSTILKNTHISCTPENIQIISGAQQGIDIISKALLKEGDYVITESPTYTGAIAVFKSRGAEIIDIDMSHDGPSMNVMEYNLKKYKPKFIYTIPSFQNPTGCSYSDDKRRELVKLASKYNAYIIEDDYVSDLNFDNLKIRPLKSIDSNQRVIFIKSFSKIFMPGLRLGFMIVPDNIMSTMLEAKHTTDISTSGLIQRAFDLYIRKGLWDKHFDLMYNIYSSRYYKSIQTLEKHLNESVFFSRPGGGLNLWLKLPYSISVNTLLTKAAAENIVFAPGRIFFSNSSSQKNNCMRISFAAVSESQIEQGLIRLCGIIDAMMANSGANKSIHIL